MPAPDGGDDFVWIGGPGEGQRFLIVLFEEAVDRGLQSRRIERRRALVGCFVRVAKKPSTALSQEADFRARALRSPVTDFSKAATAASLSPLSVAARCAASKRQRAALIAASPSWVKKCGEVESASGSLADVLLVLLHEGAAHCGLPVLQRPHFDLRASFRLGVVRVDLSSSNEVESAIR